MNFFGNIFGCCNNRFKTSKKSDIEIVNGKTIQENNITHLSSEKNTQINHNHNNSFNHYSKSNHLELYNSRHEEEEKKSATFQKNNQSQSIQSDNNIEDKKIGQNLSINNPELKKTILSITELSFNSDKNIKKEDNFSKLLLTGDLFFGKKLIITDTGLINSKRNKKDGMTFFGLKNSKDVSGKLNNDFIINFNKTVEDIGNVDTESGKVFQIIFNKKTKEYSLFFINPYLYLYYKINNFVYFYPQRNYFLFVGKIFLFINIQKEGNDQIINIQVDNSGENNEKKAEMNTKFSFNQNKSLIKIGRVNCDININEKCISKIHGIIEFSKNNQHFYYKDMNSTNGTTLLVKKDDYLKIKGEMNFKLEDVTFKIQEIP